ncbi:hypothetical protein ACFLTR_04060 [Chloroflexota bacterium]
MLRAGLRLISFGLILFLLVLPTACLGKEEVSGADMTSEPTEDEGKTGGEEQVSIAVITSNPTGYEGKTVTLSGEYRGWEAGHGSPPVTRSDWILKDETGAIYVTGKVSPGLDPVEDRGKKITVYGVAKVKDNQAYIEAEEIR